MESEAIKQDQSLINDEAQKNKRRSKNDPEGRSFKCDICGKSYLSKPAVTQHVKSKHPDELNGIKRGRGRPKKDENPENNTNNREIFMKTFFDKSLRVRGIENFSIESELLQSFSSLFAEYKNILFNDWQTLNLDYPILKARSSDTEQEDSRTFDEAIIKYIYYMGNKTSKNYFKFVCKFVILFREFINKSKKGIESVSHPFSEHNSADSIPESCNDFIVDFLEENNFFGLEMIEVIESIQHFCTWLYEKGLTNSLLSLISS